MTAPLRLAVVRDFRPEGWPSMDLCADQLLAHLPESIRAEDVAPAFRRFASRFGRAGFNADRLLNRHLLLPGMMQRLAARADFLHIVDHSYAHLALAGQPGRTGVYCHDLDAFRSILEPELEARPFWYRRLARRTLDGLKRAAIVFHSTGEVRAEILRHKLVAADRLVHAPYGVAEEFTPDSVERVERPGVPAGPYLLHVGSNEPRKRIDVLLAVFAAVRMRVPELRLVRVGDGAAGTGVVRFAGLTRNQLAKLYRRAAAVLVPSEREGFGLPVIEALACDAPVIASDISTLREAGGAGALYCPVADVPAWTDAVTRVLLDPGSAPPRAVRLAQAARFTWSEHARIIAGAYLRLAERGG